MSGSASRITRKPVRSRRWSSAITTRDLRAAGARRAAAAGPRRRASAPGRPPRGPRRRAAAARPRAAISSATRGPAIWHTTSRGEDLARAGGVAEPAGDDHRRAVEVVVRRAAARRRRGRRAAQAAVGAGRRALHVHRAAHGRDGAREGDHQPVAGRLDLATAVLGDGARAARRSARGAGRPPPRRRGGRTAPRSRQRSVNRIVTNGPSMRPAHHRRSPGARVIRPGESDAAIHPAG